MPYAVFIVEQLELVSVANKREHWSKRAERASAHRLIARARLTQVLAAHGLNARIMFDRGGVCIQLVRCAPRELDDDNLRSAFKAFRDGIADALGVDDRDPRITWQYAQEKLSKRCEVRVVIRHRPKEESSCPPP